MITTNIPNSTSMSAINAKVDIQTDSTLVSCTCGDYLQEFVLHREGDTSRFFGFGIVHKLDLIFIDLDRKLSPIKVGNTLTVALGSNSSFDYPYPTMYITELARNEKSSNITCVAYDSLFKANSLTVADLGLKPNYSQSVKTLGQECARVLGLAGFEAVGFDTYAQKMFLERAFLIGPTTNPAVNSLNVTGEESLRFLLDAMAEYTQSIYYINHNNKLVLKTMNPKAEPVLTVTKDMYFELTTLTPRTITGLCHATELGNNLIVGDETGVVQIMRSNPFYEFYIDEDSITQAWLRDGLENVEGLTFHQLECEWDGNHCLEIGDKIAFVTEDDTTVTTYLINDTIEYQGFLNEITSWEFTQDEDETDANPTNIGDKINQTYAKVDKVNKEVSILAQNVAENTSELASIKLTTDDIVLRVEKIEDLDFDLDLNVADDENFKALAERVGQLEITDEEINASISNLETTLKESDEAIEGEIVSIKQNLSELALTDTEIRASVSAIEQNVSSSTDSLNKEIETLTKEVNLKISSEDVTIAISKTLQEGVDKVTTTTKKFTFDDAGLNIGSSDSEINTTVSEDGMRINRQNQEVLVADNRGVRAEDLHATTYLIIGENSRLEDWKNSYTACFWIGGNN